MIYNISFLWAFTHRFLRGIKLRSRVVKTNAILKAFILKTLEKAVTLSLK